MEEEGLEHVDCCEDVPGISRLHKVATDQPLEIGLRAIKMTMSYCIVEKKRSTVSFCVPIRRLESIFADGRHIQDQLVDVRS